MAEGEADKDRSVGGQVRARETSSAWRQQERHVTSSGRHVGVDGHAEQAQDSKEVG